MVPLMQTNRMQTNERKLFACRLMAQLVHTTMQINRMWTNNDEIFDMQTNGTINAN